MRSYTNKDGEVISVSKLHLDTAIEIKRNLQMSSPSHKCSWKLHKQMMEQEGFYDSESSENYRLMIKSYQSSVGKLDSKEKYVDMVSSSKLNSIKEAVGDLAFVKREVQLESQKLGKLKRELSQTAVISEEIANAFKNEVNWFFPAYIHESKFPNTENKMVLAIGDWHIGAVVEESKGNIYNFEVAKKRINKLKEKTISYAKMFNVSEITIANLGDMIEGLYMRSYNQSFESEFNLSEQIIKASKLIIDLIISLSSYCNVNYFGIAGNHDRWFFDKNTIDSDNAMKIINESVKAFVEFSNSEKIKYIDVDELFNYEKTISVDNKTIKCIHGDFEGKKPNMSKHSSIEDEQIDCLVMAHYHYHQVIEEDYGKLNIINGSLMGRNSYSRKIKSASNASQTALIVTEEEVIPIRIDLQNS